MIRRRATLIALVLLAALSCDKRRAPAPESTAPAPTSSAISIVNAFGACDDLPTCEKECDAGASDCPSGLVREIGQLSCTAARGLEAGLAGSFGTDGKAGDELFQILALARRAGCDRALEHQQLE